MPPTPQAVYFVFSEMWSPMALEAFVLSYSPEGILPGHLQALLSAPPFDHLPYMDYLIDIAYSLVIAGHQRSLPQVLHEMGVLQLEVPPPPIQVCMNPLLFLCLPGVLPFSFPFLLGNYVSMYLASPVYVLVLEFIGEFLGCPLSILEPYPVMIFPVLLWG
jgi:hypothetical protein